MSEKRRNRLSWLGAVVALSGAVGSAPPAVHAGAPFVEGGELSFRLHDLAGRTVTSSDEQFVGKVVFVDIFGTWCPPCVGEIPTLRQLHAKYSEDGLMIVAIAFEHGDDADERRGYLRYFVESNDIPYLVLDGGTIGAFSTSLPDIKNAKGFPIEVFIDRDGKVVETKNGYGNKGQWAGKLEAKLVEMLAKPASAGSTD